MKATFLVLILVVTGNFAGCGHELFMTENAGMNSRRIETYYDGDSAVQTRESRRKTSEMGFGYPSGAFQQ